MAYGPHCPAIGWSDRGIRGGTVLTPGRVGSRYRRMVSVLCAGHVNWDVTLRVDRLPEPDGEASIHSQRQSGGGSAANVAVALARQDAAATLIGSVGDDDNGLLAKRTLRQAGVDLAGVIEVPDAETAVKYLLVDDEGQVSVLGNDGVNEAVEPADVDPALIQSVEHVHLTSQRPETADAIAQIAVEAGIPVSFDPGRRFGHRDYERTLSMAELVFVTEREVRAASGDVRSMVDPACTVVVTAGEEGATIYTASETVEHPGFDVEPVDATGAGDAFAAGFVATVRRGGDLSEALAYANACGALTAQCNGARSAPDREAVAAFLDRQS